MRTHRLASAALAAVLAAGCGSAAHDTTSDFTSYDPQGEWNAFDAGTVVWSATGSFSRTAGEPAELVSVEPLGLSPTTPYTSYVIMTGVAGEIGLYPKAAAPPEFLAAAESLAGRSVSAADGTFQIVVEFHVPSDGVGITGYRLHYRIGGQDRTAFIPYSDHVCVPAGATCGYLPVQS